MGSLESPFLQLIEAQAALDQGSVEPRVRELYGIIREQTGMLGMFGGLMMESGGKLGRKLGRYQCNNMFS